MKRYKKAKIVGIIIGNIFLIINLIWAVNYFSYQKYTANSPENPSPFHIRTAYSSKDGISYSVKKPDYLTISGNLAITSSGGELAILAWPAFLCGKIENYGVMIYHPDEEEGYMFYVDEEMNFHPKNYERLDPEIATAAESSLNGARDRLLAPVPTYAY